MDKKKIKLYIILLVLLIGVSVLLPYAINSVSDAIVGRITSHSETDEDVDTEELQTETEAASDNEEGQETESESANTVVLDVGFDSEIKETDEADGSSETAITDGGPEIVITDNESETAATDGGSETTAAGSTSEALEATQASSEGKTEEADAAQSEQLDEMGTYVEAFQPEISVLDGAEESYTDFLDGRETQFLAAVGEYVYSLYGDQIRVSRIEIVETVRNNDGECSCQIELFTEDGDSELFICSYNKKWDYYGVYSLYSED